MTVHKTNANSIILISTPYTRVILLLTLILGQYIIIRRIIIIKNKSMSELIK